VGRAHRRRLCWLARQRSKRATIDWICALVVAAMADHGLLHCNAVYSATATTGHQCASARRALVEQQRALRVDVDEHDLHRHGIGPVTLHDLAHTVEDQFQPQWQLAAWRPAC
jgi:hypothetical protein